jgi:zinc protease
MKSCRKKLMGHFVLLASLLCGAIAPAHALLPIEHWHTQGGARVYFVASHEIPMLDISVDFVAGTTLDPAGKSGVASLTQYMLRLGAGGWSEQEIEERLADIGASLGGSTDQDRARVTLRSLSSLAERTEAVEVLRRIVQRPNFPEAQLAREKRRLIASIRDALTKPDTVADITFRRAIYGEHPYGRVTTAASIAGIEMDDLRQFHARYYRSDRAVISIIGALSRGEAEEVAESIVAELPRAEEAAPVLPPPVTAEPGADKRVAHDATQAHILIGAPVLRRGDPDFFALQVGIFILGGGGFVSRLMQAVREDRGLAYSVYSYFQPMKAAGPFEVGLQTQRKQADEALSVVRDTLAKYIVEGPTEAEVASAKQSLIAGFPLRLDNNRKILDHLTVIGFYRLPLNYLDNYVDRIAEVSLSQVRDAFARRVRFDELVTIVVGGESPPAQH